MCIDSLTHDAKNTGIEKLRTGTFVPKHRAEILRIIKFIEQGKGSDGEEFLYKMRQTDAYREQNFIDTHAEIAKVMGF
jgi:hypothetical protein